MLHQPKPRARQLKSPSRPTSKCSEHLRALSPRHRMVRRLLPRGAEITNSNFFGDACAEAGAQNIGCASLNENPEPVLQSRSQALRAHQSEAASKAAACAGGVGMMAAVSKLVHRDGMPRPRSGLFGHKSFSWGRFKSLRTAVGVGPRHWGSICQSSFRSSSVFWMQATPHALVPSLEV